MRTRSAMVAGAGLVVLALSGTALAADESALSYGSGGCGKLQGGVALPCRGPNFEAGAATACLLGRNYLHPLVRDTVVAAFQALAIQQPGRTWQYGETGKASGGRLWPHKTHQNGLAADFFMPVVNKQGQPQRLSISVLNKFGYALEFSKRGTLDGLRIDWQAVGAQLLALAAAGQSRGVTIERIIITPDFHQPLLQQVPALQRLAPLLMKHEAWVRHDEHFHVDFAIPVALRKPLQCH